MEKLDKVIAALECCVGDGDCDFCCPYWTESESAGETACSLMRKDALRILKMWDVLHKDLWDRTHEIVRLKKELKAVRAERDTALEKLSWLEDKPVLTDNGEYCPPAPREGM